MRPQGRISGLPGLIASIGALAAPALAARLLWTPGPHAGPGWACPLLETTGVPCPACGATRAVVHLVHGDGAFLHYNWAWLVIWALLFAWVAQMLSRSLRGKPLIGKGARRAGGYLQRRPSLAVALPFAVLVVPWLVALANVGWIRPS